MDLIFWIFYLFDFIVCSVLSFMFTRYYVNKNVPRLIVIFSRLFLFANYLLIFTLPYEVIYYNVKQNALKENNTVLADIMVIYELYNNSNNNYTNETNITNPDVEDLKKILTLNYDIIFWVLVTLSNQVIFYFIYYEESGEFTFWRKLFDSIKKNLLRTIITLIIFGILSIYILDVLTAAFIGFNIINIAYAFAFLGLTLVKLPRNMYIHSNNKLALEYYEFKANKKSQKLNKNNEELKKIYLQCQKTLKYMQNIEEFLESDKSKNKVEKKEELNESTNINNDITENEITNFNDEEIKEIERTEDQDNTKEKDSKEDLKIDEDYKKHKSILKYKKYIDMLYENISEIIKKNNIEIVDELNESPIKNYKKIVPLNAKSKELDKENERINSQIQKIYKNWSFIKEISIKRDEQNLHSNDDKDINSSLNEDNYISSLKFSPKKIEFYKKYNKHLYISLMIIFIIIDILILLSEFSLILPVNLSLFSIIIKNISAPILIHFFCLIFSTIFFLYVTFSFGKIKSIGRKYLLFGGKQTNSLGLLTYCQKLSTISFPLSMNIIRMIFNKNMKDETKSILEEKYGANIGHVSFYIIIIYIPLFLIIVIIFYYFDILGRLYGIICKKKKKAKFYIKNELREQYILEGREFLIKLNKKYYEIELKF